MSVNGKKAETGARVKDGDDIKVDNSDSGDSSYKSDKDSGSYRNKDRDNRSDNRGDKPFRRKDGDRPYRKDGDKPFRRNDGDRPYRGRDDNRGDNRFRRDGGDRPYRGGGDNKPFRGNGGDRPYRGRDDNRGDNRFRRDGGDRPHYRKDGDKPFRRNDGDRPYRGRDDNRGDNRFRRDGGDRPYRKDGDKPFRRNDGDRPYRGRDDNRGDNRFRRDGGDRPPYRKDGDRPFRRNDGDRPFRGGGDNKPFRRNDGDRPYRKDGDKPFRRNDNEHGGRNESRDWRNPERHEDDKPRGRLRQPQILIYNKPIGTVVSRVPLNEGGGKEAARPVFDDLPDIRGGRWLSVGRLDVNTEGLLLFVDDGDLANRLAHPRYGVQREYLARVSGELSAAEQKRFCTGIVDEEETLKADSIRPESEDPEGGRNKWYRLQMSSGKYRAIRRLFAFFGLRVSRLKRVRMGPFELPRDLASGDFVFADAALLAGEDMVNVREQPPLPEPANAALFDGEDENENADASESESESAEASANETGDENSASENNSAAEDNNGGEDSDK